MAPMENVRSLIEAFATRLAAVVEHETLSRARIAVESAIGRRGPGRPAKIVALRLGTRARRKGPKQLCPVPGCKKPAAPVFGMVCAEHKGVAKTKIKKYRELRRAKREKGAQKAA
jgi:hypothetical protein